MSMVTSSSRQRRGVRSLKLPHEHDESAEPSRVQDANVCQASRDMASGQVDTDNYTRATEIAKGAPKKRRLRP